MGIELIHIGNSTININKLRPLFFVSGAFGGRAMAWNPSQEVRSAREYSKKFKQKIVVIMAIDDQNNLSYASYGRDKNLCENAKQIADDLFNHYMENYIPVG